MTLSLKVFLAVGGCCLLLSALTVGTAATAVYRAGTIDVEVFQNGGEISVRVPAAVANLALAFTPTSAVPDEAFDEIPSEVAQFLPVFDEFGEALAKARDFVLVEVRSRDEHVRVEKSGDRIIVFVETADERVRVSVPIKTLQRALVKADRLLERV